VKILNKQSGFSLMEIMIAAALMGGLALAVAKLMQDQSKAVKTIESRSEYNAVITDIRNVLSFVDSCNLTMGAGVTDLSTTTVIPDIKFLPDPSQPSQFVTRYVPGELYGNGNVKIKSDPSDPTVGMRLVGFQRVGSTAFGSAELLIDFIFNQNTGGTKELTRRVNLAVETQNATSTILKDCYSTGSNGIDSRYLQREGDLESRTMRGDLIMAAGHSIIVEDGTGTVQFLSDARLKHEIKDMKYMLPKLRRLRPSTYKWRSDDRDDLGLIAQELRSVFPTLVREGEKGFYTVDYIRLTPLLLKGIQEVDRENVELKKSIKDLKHDIKKMDHDIQFLKQHVCKDNADKSICR
jgi:prepilin-type N-terminal cleavage/methylation domain-containing protein